MTPFYRLVRLGAGGGSARAWRMRVVGSEHLPDTGGYVLAPSHRSMIDITLAAWLTRRPLRYMGKVSLFRVPVLGRFFTVLGGFPVQRDGTDRKALRDAIEMLRNDEILLVYPEGTRQNGPKIQPLQRGAAYLALRAGVPILPVGMAGTEEILRGHGTRLPRFGKVVAVIGEPIATPPRDKGVVPREEVEALTARLYDALQQLLDEAYELRDGELRDDAAPRR